jgi:hypothetical protein
MRKTQKLRLDKVDGIFEPAFVVPANISADGYIFSGPQAKTEMQKAIFYAPPLQFLCRDGYGNMDFQEQLLNTVRTDKRTRAYLRKNAQEREQMYLQLQTSLQTFIVNKVTMKEVQIVVVLDHRSSPYPPG